ncbi:single-stranded-DNA-specific exonuclease RecJ [Candidatus Cerribacteria bacterium 'Amazon FNV 2010 28 9']|uniref:Single-stranded-DNA-specific exonuclease RecJ n=1 Tax=Candidatus Cerribacteria bacterium 'Amazon FNV 2010 28 9' TaxID=2081795 RepID=A0A317JV79_9BACT|nr:MAG: single-stranded-DNA-specific exonuclease RecJ [Candidatus Cerribacteria bacterium 'Amazon FNV 2010 28 9']
MQWNIQNTVVPKNAEELIAVLITNRHIEDRQTFLHPKHPMDISLQEVGLDQKEMSKAVERLETARQNNQSVIIFGDYDCDGVCATAVLWETMHTNGWNVFPFIPNRQAHGYGLSSVALDEILGAAHKPAVLITVDNGIVAHTQFERLRQEGVYTILTDHHESDGKFPPAEAILHTTKLCGTTVAWMLARELGKSESIESMLDLCAIATIADQVPLVDANRSFALFGLEQLNQTTRLGLQLLIQTAGLQLGEIDTYAVNFGIAPRINAMGRLESALDALRALCTTNPTRALQLIGKLQDVNEARQNLTTEMIECALAQASEWKDERIIIVADPSFHEGVIGLIASKLTETFYKPSIVLSIGEKTAKGSARSVSGVHITNLLRSVKNDLLEVGGHPMAAGLKLEVGALESFKTHLYEQARIVVDVELLTPRLDVDCVIDPSLLSLEIVETLQQLEPFGAANREPIFAVDECIVEHCSPVGKEGKHLKLKLCVGTIKLDAIWFGKGEQCAAYPVGSAFRCAGYLRINEWKKRKNIQLLLKDIQAQ